MLGCKLYLDILGCKLYLVVREVKEHGDQLSLRWSTREDPKMMTDVEKLRQNSPQAKNEITLKVKVIWSI